MLLLWLSFLSQASSSTIRAVVIHLRPEGYLTPIVLEHTRGSFRSDHMAAKKKPNLGTSKEANASTEVQPSTNNTLVTTNGNNNNDEDNGENISVDDLAEGEFEVDLSTRKRAKGPGQRYQLLLQPVLIASVPGTDSISTSCNSSWYFWPVPFKGKVFGTGLKHHPVPKPQYRHRLVPPTGTKRTRRNRHRLVAPTDA